MVELDSIQGDIRYRPQDHRYTHIPTGRELTSVSRVIQRIYAVKSWDGADPWKVEHARIRGTAVDRVMSVYLKEGSIVIREPLEIQERVVIAQRLFEEQFAGQHADAQVIVYSLEDGVAGTMDFWINRKVIADLKCTWAVESSWALQLGAYATYAAPPPERLGVLHVHPKVYRNGGKWIEYPVDLCRQFWASAIRWWKDSEALVAIRK